jgi:hypothetical protein
MDSSKCSAASRQAQPEKSTRRAQEREFEQQLSAYGASAVSDMRRLGPRSRTLGWVAFSSAAAAAAVMPGTAEATVIYSGPQNIDVGPIAGGGYSAFDNVNFDLDGDAVNDIRLGVWAFYYGEFLGGDVRAVKSDVFVARDGTPAKLFASGSTIGSSEDFSADRGQIFDASAGGFNPAMGWDSSGQVGFAGIKIDDQYAWIQIEVVSKNHMVVVDWAYETEPGVPIKAGDTIPEPGAGALTGLGLLALGAEGIRRRRANRE